MIWPNQNLFKYIGDKYSHWQTKNNDLSLGIIDSGKENEKMLFKNLFYYCTCKQRNSSLKCNSSRDYSPLYVYCNCMNDKFEQNSSTFIYYSKYIRTDLKNIIYLQPIFEVTYDAPIFTLSNTESSSFSPNSLDHSTLFNFSIKNIDDNMRIKIDEFRYSYFIILFLMFFTVSLFFVAIIRWLYENLKLFSENTRGM